MTMLYRYSKDEVGLETAIGEAARIVTLPYGLFYLPTACLFGLWDTGGAYLDSDGITIPLGEAFEVRLFGGEAELRWVQQTADGKGRVVLLADKEMSGLPTCWKSTRCNIVHTLENDYVLWGEAGKPAGNAQWTELRTARIGSIFVPYKATEEKQRVVLKTREYLEESVDGNVIVTDERLISFGTLKREGTNRDG